MPITFAHAATVFPLKRILHRFNVFAALVIGSMTPDIIYYLPTHLERNHTHNFEAIIWFCIPAGLVVYVMFQQFWRHAVSYLVRQSTPAPRYAEWPDSWSTVSGLKRLLALMCAIAFGAGTHIVWDNLVWAVGYQLSLPHVPLAILNSLAGFAVMAYYIRREYRTEITELLGPERKRFIKQSVPGLLFVLIMPWVIGAGFGLYRVDFAMRISRILYIMQLTFFSGVAAMAALMTVLGFCVRVAQYLDTKLGRAG